MEAVGAIIGSALTEPFRLLFGSIYAKINNMFKIHSNYNHLVKEMAIVSAFKSRLREALDDDQLQHLLPKTQVQGWLSKVEELENNFSFVTASGITNTGASCSLNCKLSNTIVKQIVKVKQLIEDGNSFENMIVGVNPVPVPRPVQYIEVASIKGQPTASRNLANLIDLLRNEKYKRIGVWGMGGVGKTTLVKNLNNELSKNQTFSNIIWVTVSQIASVESVQSKIAEKLHLNMGKDVSKEIMAGHLYNKLKGKRFLLILDDIWEEIDLDTLGIPQPNQHTGSKIILTTRDSNVCQQMMTDYEFKIGRLHPEEAWKLFCERAGEEVVNDDKIKPLAEAIVEECDGLPLAIVTVGASLRKKREVGPWERAFDALQKSEPSRIKGVEEKVYKPLKWSYDSLQGEQLKSCFLFLCLFPEDFEIDVHKLGQYWLAEGLIDEQQNFEQLRNEVLRIVDYLKDSCLLEKVDNPIEVFVKMHDVVRDVGVWIAKVQCSCKSINKAGISGSQISQQMFNYSEGVKRVSFMESNIKFLPYSLRQLGELRALFLEECNELVELPPLAELGMLQVLNCSRSAITKLPEDFEKLTNLRQLDLSRTPELRKIPSENISNLRSLEFLNMMDSAAKWGMRKVNEENLPFEELLCLDQLVSVHIDLKDISHAATNWLGKINSFSFNVSTSDRTRAYATYLPNTKRVFFSDFLFSGEESIRWLLVHAFDCEIGGCEGVDLMLDNMVRSSVTLANLKRLHISYCCISVKPLSLGCVAKCDLLPNLEELTLYSLTKLESLSDFSNFLGLRFTKLKVINVSVCYELQNLLTMDETLQKLEKVETIRIWNCGKLTQVFKSSSTDNFVPNLKSLDLNKLPALEELCKADASWQSLERLSVMECNMLQKLPLGVQSAENIESIRGEQHWWDQLQWDNENLKMRLHPHFDPYAL